MCVPKLKRLFWFILGAVLGIGSGLIIAEKILRLKKMKTRILPYDNAWIKEEALKKCNKCIFRRVCSLYHEDEEEKKKSGYVDRRPFGAMKECRLGDREEGPLNSWGIS